MQRFSDDKATMPQAKLVMWLDDRRGALVVKAVVSAMKMVIVGKGRDESGNGAGGMFAKKRSFNQ